MGCPLLSYKKTEQDSWKVEITIKIPETSKDFTANTRLNLQCVDTMDERLHHYGYLFHCMSYLERKGWFLNRNWSGLTRIVNLSLKLI